MVVDFKYNQRWFNSFRKNVMKKQDSSKFGQIVDDQTIRVLMIGDSNFQSSFISTMLENEKDVEYRFCRLYDDVKQAILAAEKTFANIIVINLNIIKLSGLDMLRLFRETPSTKNIPILLLSSEEDHTVKAKAFMLGANDYIVKSGDKVEFIARIKYHSKRYFEVRRSETALQFSRIPTKHSIKVLMIDDAKVSIQFLELILAREKDITFKYCSDPKLAISVAEEYLPTVILQSLVVGNQTGFDMLKLFRNDEVTKDVPIIILSGTEKSEEKVRLFAEGANDFVIKSKNPVELVSRIRTHSSEYFNILKGKIESQTSIIEQNTIKVFMVDDSATYCKIMEQLLSNEKEVDMFICKNPLQAIESAKKFSPTVILQDINMPGIDGLTLLRFFREEPATRDVPVVILSSTSDPTVKAKAFGLGANDFMEKKVDKIELMSRIHYHTKAYKNSLKLNELIEKSIESQKKMEVQRNFIRKTFGRYISDAIVDSILESPDGLALGGEKREVTIMMTDLRGFTRLGEQLTPEQVISIINNYLRVMTDILMKHGGTIDEFIGDAILAIFGAPEQNEDHAEIAVACAMEMQIAMKTVNANNAKEGLPEVEMGIGLNTGEVVVGNIGSEKRTKYGVVGKNVNLTSRIESYTTGNQVFISATTLEKVGNIVKVRGEMSVEAKGVQEPVTIYDISGINGKYNLHLENEKVEFHDLVYPLQVNFALFEGKSKSREINYGKIIKLSKKGALINAELKMSPFTNINLTLSENENLDIKGEIFAKTLDTTHGESTFEVRFTYLDKEIKNYFEELL